MDALKHKIYLSQLFETYQDLLTEKQRQYFNLTINEDLSLNEIAKNYNVSRTAIHDANQKTEKILIEFESKLNILATKLTLEKIVEQYEKTENKEVQQLVKKIKGVI